MKFFGLTSNTFSRSTITIPLANPFAFRTFFLGGIIVGCVVSIESVIVGAILMWNGENVKHIIQDMIRKHLGWLVVWGGVFGGLIGLLVGVGGQAGYW